MKEVLKIGKKKYIDEAGWHSPRTYNVAPYIDINVCGMITGCGIAQLRGVRDIDSDNLPKFHSVIESIINDYKKDGAGCILCTLGENYFSKEEWVLKLGFEKIREYHNYRHGGTYKQRLYSLTY